MSSNICLVDLDETLAEYHGWKGPTHIGDLIPDAVNAVQRLHREGYTVVLFTSRIAQENIEKDIPDYHSMSFEDKLNSEIKQRLLITAAIRAWLDRSGLEFIEDLTCEKRSCALIFDSQAISTPEGVLKFIKENAVCKH